VGRLADARAPLSELQFSTDLRILGFAAALSLIVGLTFGVLPALGAARVDAAAWLGQAASSASRSRRWIRSALCVAQLGLTLTLLVGALLMARTVRGLNEIDLGFEPEDIMAFEVNVGGERPTDAARAEFYREMVQRLRGDRRVIEASWALMAPLRSGGIRSPAIVAGEDEAAAEDGRMTYVGPGYFEVLRTPIVAGRSFTSEETLASGPSEVVILGESLARSLFGEGHPLGELVRFPQGRDPERVYRVVGIAADVRFSPSSMTRGVDPMAYQPFSDLGSIPGDAFFMVRARPGAEDVGVLIRSTVAALEPEGVSPLDPLSWILATLLLALVATIAVAAPVRRATLVDPIEVLRAG
jgi:hypothetical protein